MITIQKLTLRRGPKLLLEDINLTIYAQQKIGLIGDNGCGKTSFFGLLNGELEANQGNLSLPNNLEIAEVKQEIPHTDQSALDYVIDGDRQFRGIEAKLQTAELNEDAMLMAECHDALAHIDGYAITGKAEKILRGLGFQSNQLQQATRHFSGGWRMRLNLAQALMSRADLMLLDEPTNHLDLDAIIWLEKWLQAYSGTLLIISHDREFLDNTTQYILHFQDQRLQLYKGNYSSFEKQQAEQLAVQQASYEKQQTRIAHMRSFVDRFGAKASKARQAQSRLKAIQKIELIAAVQTRSQLSFTFKPPKSCPNPLLRIEKATLGYELEKPVLLDVDLQIAPSDRIGLLGINGAGKSTFIKSIAGLLTPLKGTVQLYKGLKIGYFAQHQIEYLDLSLSPIELLREIDPHKNEQEFRSYLGSFNFSGEMATSKITHFSGGEKARVALALIIWQAPNLLLLDEPTNHLDMNMREALILALQDYTGALIVVSHDRHLIRTTTDELLLVSNREIVRFQGDLDDYRTDLLKKNSEAPKTSDKNVAINTGKEKRKLETKLANLEKELASFKKQKENLDQTIGNNEFYSKNDQVTIKKYLNDQKQLEEKIQAAEELWLKIVTEIEDPSLRSG